MSEFQARENLKREILFTIFKREGDLTIDHLFIIHRFVLTIIDELNVSFRLWVFIFNRYDKQCNFKLFSNTHSNWPVFLKIYVWHKLKYANKIIHYCQHKWMHEKYSLILYFTLNAKWRAYLYWKCSWL